jgi:hypothetical protein
MPPLQCSIQVRFKERCEPFLSLVLVIGKIDDLLLWWRIAANSDVVLGEGLKMISRFVVVPAIPTEMGSMRNGTRFYCETAPIGFNIYDNEEKLRLKTTYQAPEEAEVECQRLNLERLQYVLAERESMTA